MANDKSENKQISSDISLKNGNSKYFFNMNNLILNEMDSSDEININKTKKENNIKNIKKIRRDKSNENYRNINKENIINKNYKSLKTNFITDNNNELKCSCTKVQCDKLYCECFRTKRYCINCNCKNCLNLPPKFPIIDKNKELNNLNKNQNLGKKIFCTCSKSGCKLKYCECYKLGLECTNLCRCIKCKNCQTSTDKNKFNKICFINSICIINNILTQGKKELFKKKKLVNKKRKRVKNIINQNKERIKGKKIEELNNKENSLNNSLFDKNGKMIFTHFNIKELKKFESYN